MTRRDCTVVPPDRPAGLKILFAFENALPSREADAEVFVTTARSLAPLLLRAWLHVPLPRNASTGAIEGLAGMRVVRAAAPLRPAALRHFCCGITLVGRRAFREADLVYTRNVWIAWMATAFGKRVAFDHYRPWPDQIPPLRFLLYRLNSDRRFLVNICHSNYTRRAYLALGIPARKLHCVHNGYEPQRLAEALAPDVAKRLIDVPAGTRTVVYTGRLNHKKGLDLVVDAAKRLPDVLFVLVGSAGEGAIEIAAREVANIRIVGWQSPESLARYIFAADILLIPPSWKPLAEFGSTVLPLKLFLYMASGRPILAGDTPDVRELLTHGENAFLCRPDRVDDLVAGVRALTDDAGLAARLAQAAQAGSRNFTWERRAHMIAGLLEAQLQAAPMRGGAWNVGHTRRWLGASRRWLVHLVRTGSWVLPPAPGPGVP